MIRKHFNRQRISERKYDRPFNKYLNEEMDNYELRSQVIKVLNTLDRISQVATEGQIEEYIKPVFEKMLEFKNELK